MNITETDSLELSKIINNWLAERRCLLEDEALVVDLHTVKLEKVKINVIQQQEVASEVLSQIIRNPIESLGITTQPSAERGLYERGIRTVGDVVKEGRGILRARNLGRKTFCEIRDKLRAMGFKLGKEWMVNRAEQRWIPDTQTTIVE